MWPRIFLSTPRESIILFDILDYINIRNYFNTVHVLSGRENRLCLVVSGKLLKNDRYTTLFGKKEFTRFLEKVDDDDNTELWFDIGDANAITNIKRYNKAIGPNYSLLGSPIPSPWLDSM